MKKSLLRIATRKSALALCQTNYIKSQLQKIYPKLVVELIEITTTGDKNLNDPLHKVGGKRLFVKELEQALLEGKADLAVHSLKDIPADIPLGLTIAAISKREDPRDVLLSNVASNLASLPTGAVVGTTSLRRICQLRAIRPDLEIKPLRGNVDTRLQRLDEHKFDAIVLAAAGLNRLGLQQRITEFFSSSQFLPAAGQGALAIETREDQEIREIVRPLNHEETQYCVTAERALNLRLDGGCQVPIGALATLKNGQLLLEGLVGSPDGKSILRANGAAKAKDAEILGVYVAEDLLKQGAEKILQAIKTPENGFGA